MDKSSVDLSLEELKRLKIFIKKEFGIALDDKQLLRAKKRIENVLISNGFELFSPFYHQLRFGGDTTLKQDLINAITINETYFWREHEHFSILAQEVLPKVAQNQEHIRILVAPTSSGEELYSIMFAILDEGSVIKKRDIEMVGIDIDSNMIAKAKEGLYSRRSVEKLPKPFLERYFKKEGELYRLHRTLRQSSTFLQRNIFDKEAISKLGRFDIIFSRNMLIYFDMEQKREVLDIFYTLLKDDGLLFLGHADANGIDKSRFRAYQSGSHIYQKV